MTTASLEGLVKRASDRMRSDDNTKLVTKYIEHLSWLLFLRVFEAVEDERELLSPGYARLIDGEYRWSEWAHKDWDADELIAFVTGDLFPHLRDLDSTPQGRLVASMFGGVSTVMKSGFGLKEVLHLVDKIDFQSPENTHTLSLVYESLLARLGRDASWSGEHYTPRPIVRFAVRITDPQVGETVYDPAMGSAGFLVESFEHAARSEKTLEDHAWITTKAFHGKESGELAFLLGTMNLLLHGVEEPQVVRRNTLEQDIRGVALDQQFNVILTNPPFGGKENKQLQQNFPQRAAATELLFLQHVIAHLRPDGRAAVVVPDGILFRDEGAFASVRRALVEELNITAIIRLPLGTFPYAPDTRTNLLFFDREGPTSTIRYYQVRPPEGRRAFTKTRPVTDESLSGALEWLASGTADNQAWAVDVEEIRSNGYDLDLLAPYIAEELDPKLVRAELEQVDEAAGSLIASIAPLAQASTDRKSFSIERLVSLGPYIERRGARPSEEKPAERFIGVSNTGGLSPFKGKVAKDTSKYRLVEVGDLVYNPMRINVGSIALCRDQSTEGYASSEYVVFKLKDNAPFSTEYLLRYLQSTIGQHQIDRNAQGTIRSRLYFENLCDVEVPVPRDPTEWDRLLVEVEQIRRSLLDLQRDGSSSVRHLVDSLFFHHVSEGWSAQPSDD